METPTRKPLKNNLLSNVQKQEPQTPFRVPASPLMKSLGFGTGVNVYYLERSPKLGQARSPWAVKRVSQRTRTTNKENSKLFNERIRKEADILRQLSHPNIVGFRGISKENDDVDTLALECCTTSLGTVLEERLDAGDGPLPAHFIKKMVKDIASALDYLHTKALLLHGDLKSHNILVKGDFEICKLCDFGVSLPLDKDGQIDFRKNPELNYVGTSLWCAPEIIAEEELVDSKADIFSLGLIIYETIALIPPHTIKIDDSEEDHSKENDTFEDSLEVLEETASSILDTEDELQDDAYGTRPLFPEGDELTEDYNIVMELFYLCTNQLSEDRPTAAIVYECLNKCEEC